MNQSLELTYNELYYLGNLVSAKFIDYMYFSAIDDIDNNYELFKDNVKNSLQEKKLLFQDFSGNVCVDEACINLLKPIFFGKSQTELDIITNEGKNSNVICNKLHYHNGKITSAFMKEESVVLTDSFNFKEFFKKSVEKVKEYISDDSQFSIETLLKDKVNCIIVAKSAVDFENVTEISFVIFDGKIYEMIDESTFKMISLNYYEEAIKNIIYLKGDFYGLS